MGVESLVAKGGGWLAQRCGESMIGRMEAGTIVGDGGAD